MTKTDPLTLREAQEKGKLRKFAKEQDAKHPPGDHDKFKRALHSMVGKSKAKPAASKPDPSAD